jgi:hypothetical protein
VRLLRVDTTGGIADTFPGVLRFLERPRLTLPRDFDRSALDYFPKPVWHVTPGGAVWTADSGELRLVNTSLAGDTIRVVEGRHRRPSIDRATERRIEREFSKVPGLTRSDYTVTHPVVQSILVLEDGHVLVHVGRRGRGGRPAPGRLRSTRAVPRDRGPRVPHGLEGIRRPPRRHPGRRHRHGRRRAPDRPRHAVEGAAGAVGHGSGRAPRGAAVHCRNYGRRTTRVLPPAKLPPQPSSQHLLFGVVVGF